jgi:hypothetical protein
VTAALYSSVRPVYGMFISLVRSRIVILLAKVLWGEIQYTIVGVKG